MGIILPENTVSGKLGYNIDLQFIPNTSNYAVKNPDSLFEAVSRKDNSVSRSDCVEFTSIEQSAADKKDGIYRAKVKVKNETGDILIRPSSAACVLLPKITAIIPENDSKGVDQDTKIKITFNKALNPESFGDFSRLEIYSTETSDLKEFFDSPYFSEDKKSMYITPKSSRLLLAPDGGKQFMDITVALELSDVTDCDGLKVSGKINHTYRINQSYGNQKKVKVLVRTVEGTGSFLSDGEKECTVGYSLGELQFTLNKADYYFKGLEAVSKNDANVSRAEKVSFTKTDFDEERGIYKYKVTVTEEADDILIQPKCILLPKARASYPVADNTTYQQDTSIKVYFNKKIKLSDFADENGFLKNIEIKSGDTNLLDTAGGKLPYYKAPYLEDEDKTLVIPIVKGNYIIKDNSTKEISVSVKLAGLKDAVEGENADFAQASYDFSFKINSTKDSTPPQFKVLRLARTEDDARNGTNLITMDEFTHYAAKANYGGYSSKVAENIQNHHVNKVWIYFEGEDADSGVGYLEVKEQLIRTTTGSETQSEIYDKSTNENSNCFYNRTENNNYSGCFEYNFKSTEDGVVRLQLYLTDKAGNIYKKSNNKVDEIDLVKDTACPLEVYLYDPTKKYVDELEDPHKAPYKIELKQKTNSFIYAKDMDSNSYEDTFLTTDQNDFSSTVEIVSFEYGYDKSNMTHLDLQNDDYELEKQGSSPNFTYRKKHYVNINVDPYRNVYTKIIIKDLAGNIKECEDVIPKIVEIASCSVDVISENGEEKVFWNIVFKETVADKHVAINGYYYDAQNTKIELDSFGNIGNNPGGFFMGNNGHLVCPFKSFFRQAFYGGGTKSLKDLPNGIYKISSLCFNVNRPTDFYSYGNKFITLNHNDNGWSVLYDGETSISQNDVPPESDWQVWADSYVLNDGKRTVHVKILEDFIPKPSLNYYIRYEENGEKHYIPISDLSNTVDFFVSTKYCNYDFYVVAFNQKNESVSSEVKTLDLTYDNVSPEVKSLSFDSIFSSSATLKLMLEDSGVGLKEENGNYIIKYCLSNKPDLTDIDWNSIQYEKLSPIVEYNKTYYLVDIIFYETGFPNYIYLYLEDKNGNYKVFSTPVYLEFCKFYPSINMTDSTFKTFEIDCSSVHPKTGYGYSFQNIFYIDKNAWKKLSASSQTFYKATFSTTSESFIKVQPRVSQGSLGSLYGGCTYPVYFYNQYEIAKAKGEEYSCRLKDLYPGQSGINILADKPCFAHTMYCPRNLGDSPADWLIGGLETGLVMEDSSFTYSYDNTSKVPAGYYYTTVVHFADGTTLMTDVKQK